MTAGFSQRRACRLLACSRTVARYRLRRDPQLALRERIREIAKRHRRFGYRRVHWWLAQRDGLALNVKRVYRLYAEEGLQVPKRRRRRQRLTDRCQPLSTPTARNERWSMDFVSDTLVNGRRFRALTIVDDFDRASPAIEVASSLPGGRVVRVLNRLAAVRGLPRAIKVDRGPEFTSEALKTWSRERGVKLLFIDPGKPIQNAHIESFNGRFRDECLNESWFVDLADARATIEEWRRFYNAQRPHSGIGNVPPARYRPQEQTTVA